MSVALIRLIEEGKNMSWLDTPKSKHVVRREHYVTGRQDEREHILSVLQDHVCRSCEEHLEKYGLETVLLVKFPHESCEGLLGAIDCIRSNID